MKRWPFAPILVVLAASALGGGVVVALATSHDERDPAPAAASRDVAGVVAVGRPITPYAAGDPATGQIELRMTDPAGGAPLAMLFHRSQRVRQGRTIREECLEIGRERQLRRYPTEDAGACRPSTAPQPWSISITASARGPVVVHGWTGPGVKRLTAAGPGGTFVLPRSQHGAFAVAYAATTRGRMVLTATLADGSKRFFRSQIPPSNQPDGAATAADPGRLPTWFTAAQKRTDAPRRGQTCLQVQQDHALHEKAARDRGGTILAPACGDLSPTGVRADRAGQAIAQAKHVRADALRATPHDHRRRRRRRRIYRYRQFERRPPSTLAQPSRTRVYCRLPSLNATGAAHARDHARQRPSQALPQPPRHQHRHREKRAAAPARPRQPAPRPCRPPPRDPHCAADRARHQAL